MPVRKLTTLAAALALLTVTAPAHAATIQWDLSGVTNTPFSNSIATVTGFFDYNTTTQTFPTYGFSVTSSPLVTGGLGDFTLTPSTSYVSNISGPNNLQIQNNGYSDANAEILDLGNVAFDGTAGAVLLLSDAGVVHLINIDTIFPEGGDAALQGELVESAVTPLPPALPMFAAALFALTGFASWRSRRTAPAP